MTSVSESRLGTARAWFLAAGAILVASVGLVLRGEGSIDEVGVQPQWSISQDGDVTPDGRPQRQPVGLDVQPEDSQELLAAHWGDRWESVRTQLKAEGKLDDLPAELQPWDEISLIHQQVLTVTSDGQRDMFYRGLMSWPGLEFDDDVYAPLADYAEATPSTLAKHLNMPELADLDQEQVYLLEQRFADTNAELDGMIRSYMEGLAGVVSQRFRTGTIEHAPISLPTDHTAYTGKRSFFWRSTNAGDWSSQIQLYEDEYPDLAAIDRQIRTKRKQREREVAAYASELLAG